MTCHVWTDATLQSSVIAQVITVTYEADIDDVLIGMRESTVATMRQPQIDSRGRGATSIFRATGFSESAGGRMAMHARGHRVGDRFYVISVNGSLERDPYLDDVVASLTTAPIE